MKVNPIREPEKVTAIKEAMIQDGKLRLAFLFILGVNTGFRVSDLVRVKYEDIRNKEELRLKEQKTGKYRSVSITPKVHEALRLIDQGQTGCIFLSESNRTKAKANKLWGRQYITQELKYYAALAGVKQNVGTHTMRKTFGYFHYKINNNLALLQESLNHSSTQSTLRYIGIIQEDINKSVMQLNLG